MCMSIAQLWSLNCVSHGIWLSMSDVIIYKINRDLWEGKFHGTKRKDQGWAQDYLFTIV